MENVAKEYDGVDLIGLFYPRGSDYMFAVISKFRDYATFEKFLGAESFTKVQSKWVPLTSQIKEMFLDEITEFHWMQ